MSSSMHVVAFRPADDKWHRMKAVYDACQAADLAVPDEVEDYFRYEPPDPAGVEIGERTLIDRGVAREWSEGMREGYEIDVTKLPSDATVVRVYMSY